MLSCLLVELDELDVLFLRLRDGELVLCVLWRCGVELGRFVPRSPIAVVKRK